MKKKHTGTQIVAKLRQADVLIGQGKTIPEASERHGQTSASPVEPEDLPVLRVLASFKKPARQSAWRARLFTDYLK